MYGAVRKSYLGMCCLMILWFLEHLTMNYCRISKGYNTRSLHVHLGNGVANMSYVASNLFLDCLFSRALGQIQLRDKALGKARKNSAGTKSSLRKCT